MNRWGATEDKTNQKRSFLSDAEKLLNNQMTSHNQGLSSTELVQQQEMIWTRYLFLDSESEKEIRTL